MSTKGRAGIKETGRASAVVAGAAEQTLIDIQIARDRDNIGLSVGLGLSDVLAWNGGIFRVYANGQNIADYQDQHADLLNEDFIPINMESVNSLSVTFQNGSAVVTDVAASLFVQKIVR